MGYLSRNAHRRVDPQEVLPGARSLVCLALNYGETPGRSSEAGFQERTNPPRSPRHADPSSREGDSRQPAFRGIVARYAACKDYHEVMGDRLRLLSEFIGKAGGNGGRALWYVDTGPVLERDFAQRAGLGFVGKHTNMISRRFGNWILLGEILTTLELEPDLPAKLKEADDELRLVEDLGIDSLTMMEIVILVEDVLQMQINNEDLRNLRTVGDIKVFIDCKVRGLPPPKPTIASGENARALSSTLSKSAISGSRSTSAQIETSAPRARQAAAAFST